MTYSLLRLKAFGEYALSKNSYIRGDFVHQISKFIEWAWGNVNSLPFFAYADNTTVNFRESQRVTFIGASYV